MDDVDDSGDGRELYRKLSAFAELRHRELTAMFQPVVALTDAYGELASRAILALGAVPPNDRKDVAVRDLLADAFDFLYEWRRPLLEGRVHVGYPLGRRAYESVSLASAVIQDEALARRWNAGKQIPNREIRKALARLPLGEDEESLRDLYSFFSSGTHPNRDVVAERLLGDGNEYVLGSIGMPNLLMVVNSATHLVGLWFWFVALSGFVGRDALRTTDAAFLDEYRDVSARAPEVKRWLVSNYNRLLGEVEGTGPPRTG